MLPAAIALWSDKVEYKLILKIMLNSNFKMIYERGLCTYVTLVFIVEKQHKSIQRAEEQPSLQHKAAAQEPPSVSLPLVLPEPSGRLPGPVVSKPCGSWLGPTGAAAAGGALGWRCWRPGFVLQRPARGRRKYAPKIRKQG